MDTAKATLQRQLEERSKATEAEALAMQEKYQAQLVLAMAALHDLQAEVAAVTAASHEADAELAGACERSFGARACRLWARAACTCSAVVPLNLVLHPPFSR